MSVQAARFGVFLIEGHRRYKAQWHNSAVGGTADVVVAWHQRLYVVMIIRWYRGVAGAGRCAGDVVDM